MSRALDQHAVGDPESLFRTGSRRLLFVFLAAIAVLCVVRGCMAVLYNAFTDHRLLPLFLILRHDPVYINPASGPTLSTLYPPLSVLLYAPAALFHSPAPCFITAAVIAQLLWFAPVILAFHFVRRPVANSFFDALLLSTMFVMWCNTSSIMQTLYQVHADDPAIFLAAAGVLAFVADRQRPRALLLPSSAVLCSLAVWAKQPAFPVVLVPVVLLLAAKEFRRFFFFAAYVLLTHVVVLAIWSRLFDLRLMFIWLIKIPASQPWKDTIAGSLVNSSNALMNENFAALTVIGVVLVWSIHRYRGANRSIVRQLSLEPWFVLALTGVILWPTSVLGYCKVGGTENALLYSTYFIDVAVVLWLYKILPDHATAMRAALSTAFLLLLISLSSTFLKWSRTWEPSRLSHIRSFEAYNFSRKWPGEVFFPWYPLSVYLATGHLYNFDLGMCDRFMAGVKIDEASYRAHLPPHMKYVAYAGAPGECALVPLPEYHVRVHDPRLPGWTLYAKTEPRP